MPFVVRSGKYMYDVLTCHMQNFKILASLRSCVGCVSLGFMTVFATLTESGENSRRSTESSNGRSVKLGTADVFIVADRKHDGTRPQLFLLYNLIIPYNTYILT